MSAKKAKTGWESNEMQIHFIAFQFLSREQET